jgi:hypothetical protein
MIRIVSLTLVALLATALRGDTAQVVGDRQTCTVPNVSSVRAQPAVPRAGSLFHVRIPRSSAAAKFSASVSGEPLHFHQRGDLLEAIAAVPVDSITGVTLELRCESGQTSTVRIVTQPGSYKLERLHVAPQFSAAPDAAVLARQASEAQQAAVVSRTSQSTPQLWSEPFVAPRATRITSPFGGGRTFNGAVTSRHMGTDYAGAVGDEVRASNRGVVRLIGKFYLGGNVVYIDHGEGLVTAYLHLSKQLVAVGDTVQRGAVIGRVGATGRVTGPHLHLIARYGMITVDPATLLSLR